MLAITDWASPRSITALRDMIDAAPLDSARVAKPGPAPDLAGLDRSSRRSITMTNRVCQSRSRQRPCSWDSRQPFKPYRIGAGATERHFRPRGSVSTTNPHSETVGIVAGGQSKSKHEPSFSHSQVEQVHAAWVTSSVQDLMKGSWLQHAPVTASHATSMQAAPLVHA
jgi:hypothetical protein